MMRLRKRKTTEQQPSEVDKLFESFWKTKVCKSNGKLDIEQVKKELYDYKLILNEVNKVYNQITNGTFQRADYPADLIISYCQKDVHEKIVEAVKNYREQLNISDIEFIQKVNTVLNDSFEHQPELSSKTASKILQIMKDNGFLILKS